ncbi:MAG: hypothetical protein M3Z66_19325 [Chloroflexota bacterium]|nr:hypothetical protein [Chloroflexota bacterium]
MPQYEEREVVAGDPVNTVPATRVETVQAQPDTVVERQPTRTVISDDPVGNAYAASQLIQTVVWSVVVLVLLVVAILVLHSYAHIF